MKLREILKDCNLQISSEDEMINITGVAFDSRNVMPGNIFVAIKGDEFDGHNYITDAIEKGAKTIIGELPYESFGIKKPILYYRVANSRETLSKVAANFYRNPSRKLCLIGVTGTDGKTTTCNLISGILRRAGFKTGMLSTINVDINNMILDSGVHVTTPDAVSIQNLLAQMVDVGVEYAILESTSHGLSQYRVNDCEFDVGVLTNVTHEHYDYHGDFYSYREAKSVLFKLLNEKNQKDYAKYAILNADDPSYDYFKNMLSVNYYSYGIKNQADLNATQITCDNDQYVFNIKIPNQLDIKIRSKLMGIHNVYNILASIAVVHSQNLPLKPLLDYYIDPDVPEGRFEEIKLGQPFRVFVDYAHTENALLNVLNLANQITKNRVILLFGLSGGPRDKSKRPKMGRIAELNSDIAIITAVDWYTSENVEQIINQITDGCLIAGGVEGKTYLKIPNREHAIEYAINIAQSGDIVIIAGKGHEKLLSIDGIDQPWDEVEVAKHYIRKLI